MRKRTAESGVLRACLDLLAVHKIWHERRNTGAMKDGDRFIRFSRRGTADILAIPLIDVELICDADEPDMPDSWMVRWVAGYRHGLWKWKERTPLWIECKSENGKQTDDQIAFEKEVSMAGHHYLVVRDVNTLSAWLKEHGCI